MQTFRLMGMPDKVIAFDQLPKQYLEGLEMCDCTKLGRAWRDFIGKVEKVTQVKPEMDPITRQMHTFPPLREVGPYAYLIDWEINHDKERWAEIVDYVRKNAPAMWNQKSESGADRQVRMMDNLEKMALPLAKDPRSEVTLEPEEVIVVPLKGAEVEPEAPPVEIIPNGVVSPSAPAEFKCEDCGKSFAAKQGLLLHRTKKHPKVGV